MNSWWQHDVSIFVIVFRYVSKTFKTMFDFTRGLRKEYSYEQLVILGVFLCYCLSLLKQQLNHIDATNKADTQHKGRLLWQVGQCSWEDMNITISYPKDLPTMLFDI